eukprot:693508-Prorocentrum_minimum.AAC.1
MSKSMLIQEDYTLDHFVFPVLTKCGSLAAAGEEHRDPAGLQADQGRAGGGPEGERHQGLCQDRARQHERRRRGPACHHRQAAHGPHHEGT